MTVLNLKLKFPLPFTDAKKSNRRKMLPSAVGMILTKRNESEAGLSQGTNPKRKRIRTMQKTAENKMLMLF